ncbi:MAG TPA: type II secretion system F family protein, partial [Synergistaceae bacterium]|nr:type II secretion system F family protein [Synergistaceae bacterium]
MVAHMIAIGEQTGRLEEMMNKVADWFEAELDVKVGQLNSLLEPMLIVFVGGVVAVIAMAIFFPIIGAIQTML